MIHSQGFLTQRCTPRTLHSEDILNATFINDIIWMITTSLNCNFSYLHYQSYITDLLLLKSISLIFRSSLLLWSNLFSSRYVGLSSWKMYSNNRLGGEEQKLEYLIIWLIFRKGVSLSTLILRPYIFKKDCVI